MTPRTMIQIAVLVAVLVVLSSSAYQVHEVNQVIITQFGNPVGDPVTEPGLHFKVPFIQRANYFEKRFLEWDGNPNQVPTRDKRFIWVDTYARWRIVDPLRFFQRLRDERGAQSRLDDILDGETRNSVARYDLIELVRSSNRDPDDVLVESEEEATILDEIEMGRQAIAAEILERGQRQRRRPRDRAARPQTEADQLRRRGPARRLRPHDCGAAADCGGVPI